MDETFKQLIIRSEVKIEQNVGDPWEIIPIKNKKQAKNTIEIHLASRNLSALRNFQDFPNIEVLWLNNNKFEKITNLDTNFRIKQLYLQNNKLKTLDGSLSELKHLEVLLLFDNELRGLEDKLNFLKKFTNLKQLDLFNNPLQEEPNYRLKVILALPQLKLFDRHVITLEERMQAKQFQEKEQRDKIKFKSVLGDKSNVNQQSPRGAQTEVQQLSSGVQIITKKKPQTADNKKFKKPWYLQFSKAEKDLYREAKSINLKIKTQKEEEERKFKESLLPQIKLNTTIQKEEKVFGERHEYVDEWEKYKVNKIIFTSYDKDKKVNLDEEKLKNLFSDLSNDKQEIGKVPDCSQEQFIELFQSEKNKESFGKISADQFYRKLLDSFKWKVQNQPQLQKKINEKYYEANKQQQFGNAKQSFQLLHSALKLENIMTLNQYQMKDYLVPKVIDASIKRFDTFKYGQHRVENYKQIIKIDRFKHEEL